MLTLGIETSCDETSAAVVEDGHIVRSCIIASSKNDFERLGGVVPEDAARKQLESIMPVINGALKEAKICGTDLDLIAVTRGPGLLGSLLVGTTSARALAAVWKVPLIGVHHTLGHLSSTWLSVDKEPDIPSFPVLTLSISGGHTDMWYRSSHATGMLLGSTRDDAAGEAFDKGAVMLGLPYPGGPHLMKLAESGDKRAHRFPLPLGKEDTLDFSFSGLKTSLKYLLAALKTPVDKMTQHEKASIAASYQTAICSHLRHQTDKALSANPDVAKLHVVGGVAANTEVRQTLSELAKKHNVSIRFPINIRFCTDNGAMIASAGFFLAQEKSEDVDRPFSTVATIDLESVLDPISTTKRR